MDPATAVPTTSPSEPQRQPNQAARLRARLLEFLKFRVLAAQEHFFADLERDSDVERDSDLPLDCGG